MCKAQLLAKLKICLDSHGRWVSIILSYDPIGSVEAHVNRLARAVKGVHMATTYIDKVKQLTEVPEALANQMLDDVDYEKVVKEIEVIKNI